MRREMTILGVSLFCGATAWAFAEQRIPAYVLMGISALISAVPVGLTLRDRVRKLETTKLILLAGLGGTWLCLTTAFVAAGWMLLSTNEPKTVAVKTGGEGPIDWVYNFGMEGGGGRDKVFSLRFHGANVSKDHVRLREAKIRSLVDGSELALEVLAVDPATGNVTTTELGNIQLIPPGAPIELVAKFGPPDPQKQGYVQGLESKVFLETWRQFAFVAADDKRSYRLDFNENSMMPFFQGKVGPRVTAKAAAP
jgi:hypothetical protein